MECTEARSPRCHARADVWRFGRPVDGLGYRSANAMSRVYRDLVGLANQYIAKRADKVYLSVAGITIELKERGVEL